MKKTAKQCDTLAETKAGGGPMEGETKGKRLLPPPVLPIPPGETPPSYTHAELDAHHQYWAEYSRIVASYFSLDDFQKIVAKTKAPPLKDTFNTQAIMRTVCGGIQNRIAARENIEAEKVRKRHKNRRKEWSSLRKHLITLENAQRAQITWFTERPYYGPEGIDFRKGFLAKLEALSTAMDNIEGYLFISQNKSRGQHGPMALLNASMAADIFVRLSWAWEEAGAPKVAATKRYEIVQECMALIETPVSVDAIRKAITKHLRAYPYHAEKRDGNSL